MADEAGFRPTSDRVSDAGRSGESEHLKHDLAELAAGGEALVGRPRACSSGKVAAIGT